MGEGALEFIKSTLELVPEGLSAPLYYVSEPSYRIYWLFLLSSLLLVFVAYFVEHRRIHVRTILSSVFSPRYWFNKSSVTDVFYLTLNSVLRVSLLIPLFGSHLWATIMVARFLQGNFGNGPDIEIHPLAIMTLYTLIFFVVEDVSRFALHLGLHKIPFLWRFHQVHHSATTLTPLTVHRIHPVEMFLYFVRGTCVFGIVSGCFVYCFGSKLSGLQVLGVDMLGFLFNLLGANLRHSHIWLSFGSFEKWFISPAQHQIHHSIDTEHRDKNFGTCLACWDKLYGSWVGAKKRLQLTFGIA